jgi:glycosyltransferase involved in cell wall biosynthesis
MRVLIVTNMYPGPTEPWWGSFVRDQVDDLSGLGLELEVLHIEGRFSRRAYLWAIRHVRTRLEAGSYDVVHAHYGLTGAAVVLARPSVPLVVTFHGSDYGGPAWQRRVSTAVAKGAVPIVVSEEGRALLKAPGARVIPMGVDTERFMPLDRATARTELGWDHGARYALLAGSRADPIKRADLFDAAVARARTRVPELQGTALEGYDRERVRLAFNAADVTVLTSDHEGSPVAIRESLACETPVVAVPAGDTASVLVGLPGCSIVAREADALAGGIEVALGAERNPAWRERALKSSRTAIAEQVRDLYECVVDRSAS